MIDTKKYIFAFCITTAIFATAYFASNFLSQKRVETVAKIQDNIAIDILSSETQFDLLKEISCANIDASILAQEYEELGNKLTHTENDGNASKGQILYLKKYYSLLQIKDFLLSKKIAEKCAAKKQVQVIYFYGDKKDCPECVRTGYVLTKLKQEYPNLRVYSFDFNLPLSVIDSMKKIYKIDGKTLPTLVIEDTVYTGYKNYEEVEMLLPTAFREQTNKDKDEGNKKATTTESASISTSTKQKVKETKSK